MPDAAEMAIGRSAEAAPRPSPCAASGDVPEDRQTSDTARQRPSMGPRSHSYPGRVARVYTGGEPSAEEMVNRHCASVSARMGVLLGEVLADCPPVGRGLSWWRQTVLPAAPASASRVASRGSGPAAASATGSSLSVGFDLRGRLLDLGRQRRRRNRRRIRFRSRATPGSIGR